MDESFLTNKINELQEQLNKILESNNLSKQEISIEGALRFYSLRDDEAEGIDQSLYECKNIKSNPRNLNNRILSSLSIAAVSLFAAKYFKDEYEFKSKELSLEFLINAAYNLGAAKGYRYEGGILKLIDSTHKKTIGKNGGKAKNKPKQELKDWALQQAKSLKLTDRDAARHLSARIPEHLAAESKNPEQLIYRALLARHQAK